MTPACQLLWVCPAPLWASGGFVLTLDLDTRHWSRRKGAPHVSGCH